MRNLLAIRRHSGSVPSASEEKDAMKAPTHPRQSERLALLSDMGILDTGEDPAFDDLTRLARAICATPMSAVSLLAGNRQWFKSEIGIGLRETSLDDAICSHAILEPDLMEIPDTRCDPRTADNPLVAGERGLRFYAGVPLTGAMGLPLGTLCVLDVEPRDLTDHQRDALRVLARQAVMQIELRHALAEAEILRREVDHRVKNSLQILASLTAIQSRRASATETREALDLVRQRVQTIADLHAQFYAGDQAGTVDLAPYLAGILSSIGALNPDGITIESAFDAVSLPAGQAVALGLLVNEFYTNSIKHAFADRTTGRITIRLARMAPDRAMLAYRDDGVGMIPSDAEGVGLGSRVIDALVQQLGGEVERETHPGYGLSLSVGFAIPSL